MKPSNPLLDKQMVSFQYGLCYAFETIPSWKTTDHIYRTGKYKKKPLFLAFLTLVHIIQM